MAAIFRQVFEQVGIHCQRTAGTYFTHGVDPARQITPQTSSRTIPSKLIPERIHSRTSSFWFLTVLRKMEVVVTTGATRRGKIQSSPNQHPDFHGPDAVPVTQPTVSKHWREMFTAVHCQQRQNAEERSRHNDTMQRSQNLLPLFTNSDFNC